MAFIAVSNTDTGNESLNPMDFNFNDEDWSFIVRKRWSNLTPLLAVMSPVSNPLKNIKHSWAVGLTLDRYTYLTANASSKVIAVNDASAFQVGDTILVDELGTGTFTRIESISGSNLTVEDTVTQTKWDTVTIVGASQIPGATPANWPIEEITEAYNYMQEYNRLLNVAEATRAKVQYYGMTNEQSIVMGMLQQSAVDMDRTLLAGERQAASDAATVPMAGGIFNLLNTYASGNVDTAAGATKWSDLSTKVELLMSQGAFSGGNGIILTNTKGIKGIHDLAILNSSDADVWEKGAASVQMNVNINGILFKVVVDPQIDPLLRSGTARTRTAGILFLSPEDAAGNPNLKLIYDGVGPKDHIRIERYKTHSSAENWELYSRFTFELGEPQMHGAKLGITSFAAE